MKELASVYWRAGALPLAAGVSLAVLCLLALVGSVYQGVLLPVAIVGTAVVAVLLARWPDHTTPLMVGLIYSNLPVVAVRFHGAPEILPALVLAVLGWPLLYHFFLRQQRLYLSPAFPFLLVLVVVQFAGALLARSPSIAFGHFVEFVLEGVMVFLLITNAVRTRSTVIACLWALAVSAILMGGFPALQKLTGDYSNAFGGLAQLDSQFTTEELVQPRAAGTIGEQNRYSQFMALLLPITAAVVYVARPAWRPLAIFAVFMAGVGCALGFSRGAAVGLSLAFPIAAALRIIDRRQVWLGLVGVALVLLLLPQYASRLVSLGPIAEMLTGNDAGLQQADGAIRGRLTEMWAAVLVWRDHLLVGAGPGMFAELSQEYGQLLGLRPLAEGRMAHSLILEVAAEHGILGLFAFGAVFATILGNLWGARRTARQRHDQQGLYLTNGILLTLLLYLTTGLFLHLSFIRYLWLLLALGDAVARIVRDGDTGAELVHSDQPQLE